MYSTEKVRKVTWIDAVVVLVVGGAVAYVGYRIDTVLNYDWDFSKILPYIFYFDEETQAWVGNLLVQGLLITLRLALWGIVIAAVIGTIAGVLRTVDNLFLRMVARTYVELVRNIPPLVFIFVFYFFLSSQLMPFLGVDELIREASPNTLTVVWVLFGDPDLITNFLSGLICLSIFEGAYITEIVRAGIQAIPRGQWEASRSVGLTRLDVLRFVILPQAVQRIVPPLANQFITLIKDSSIVSLISIQELTFMAIEVGVSTARLFEVWLFVAGFYFVICYGCAALFAKLERRMARGKA
jgi:polar amino acid transport system permease protein